MPRKTRLENHPALFVVEGDEQRIQAWQEIEAAQAQALEFEGAHIAIPERAERLIRTMNALAHRNMLNGFDVAVNDPEDQVPIWDRYLNGTPRVIESSRSKVDRLEVEAQEHFWHATGFAALRGMGLMTRGEVRSRLAKMWRDFEASYGSPKVHDDMVKYRNDQKRFLPKSHELRQKKPREAKELHEWAA
jgi:hypothetical protein